jgi:hypothetical protein
MMKPPGIRSDNHYVPRLYLKRWADDNGLLWLYRILVSHPNVPHWTHASISALAKHQHLYTRVAAGKETDEFEDWLGRDFETPAEEAIHKAVSDDRLTPGDWECIIRFLAAQDVRTPARLMEMTARQRSILPAMTEDVLQRVITELTEAKRTGSHIEHRVSDESKNFPTRITKAIEPGAETGTLKVETVVGRGSWLWSVHRLLTSTYKVLHLHKWTVLRPPVNETWPTSDDPVIKLNRDAMGRYDFKGGWASNGTEILLPLGPHHLLYTKVGDRSPPLKGQCVSEQLAANFRKIIIEHAHRYIFCAEIEPLVEKLRPRIEDAVRFKHEAEQWNNWPDEQTKAERDLNDFAP